MAVDLTYIKYILLAKVMQKDIYLSRITIKMFKLLHRKIKYPRELFLLIPK